MADFCRNRWKRKREKVVMVEVFDRGTLFLGKREGGVLKGKSSKKSLQKSEGEREMEATSPF